MMLYFELQFDLRVFWRSAVQMYFGRDPQMTFGYHLTSRGQTAFGKVRTGTGDWYGVVFSPVTLPGGSKCFVKISAMRHLLASVGQKLVNLTY